VKRNLSTLCEVDHRIEEGRSVLSFRNHQKDERGKAFRVRSSEFIDDTQRWKIVQFNLAMPRL
jgi:hypothetical protein